MIALIILFLVNVYLFTITWEPQDFIEVKEKYEILRRHIKESEHPKFQMLCRPIPITGFKKMNGTVGYNTNKGAEIVICLDGSVNEIFHVLIHELAHSTVEEYSHSDEYWNNYIELRDICVNIGIYEKIPERTKFCGQHVQDK
jgi:hypothetical protein